MSECPSCKASRAPDDRYCGQCGAHLSAENYMEGGARTQKSLDLIDVHYNLGLVYYKKGQYREALEVWEKTLGRDPGNVALEARISEAKAQLGGKS